MSVEHTTIHMLNETGTVDSNGHETIIGLREMGTTVYSGMGAEQRAPLGAVGGEINLAEPVRQPGPTKK